jgi:hypothetical protein
MEPGEAELKLYQQPENKPAVILAIHARNTAMTRVNRGGVYACSGPPLSSAPPTPPFVALTVTLSSTGSVLRLAGAQHSGRSNSSGSTAARRLPSSQFTASRPASSRSRWIVTCTSRLYKSRVKHALLVHTAGIDTTCFFV